jgi:hypothetical protein
VVAVFLPHAGCAGQDGEVVAEYFDFVDLPAEVVGEVLAVFDLRWAFPGVDDGAGPFLSGGVWVSMIRAELSFAHVAGAGIGPALPPSRARGTRLAGDTESGLGWWRISGTDYMLPLPPRNRMQHERGQHPVIPESDNMIYCAQAIEEMSEKHGWGYAPLLGTVRDLGGLGAMVKEFPGQPALIDPDDPLRALQLMADFVLESTDHHRKVINEAGMEGMGDGLMAMWFVAEASLVPDGLEHDGVSATDNPARKTIRHVIVVDCAGYVYQVNRFRGGEPELVTIEPGTGELLKYGNEVVVALRRMLLGLGANMSSGMIDMEKVAAVGVGE